MCGRFVLAADNDALDAEFGLRRWPARTPRYNIAPTQQVLIIKMGSDNPEWVRWGLVPRWAQDPSGAARMINARSETVLEKPAFRDLVRRNRCLVPASGYYEWQATPGGGKQPFHLRRADLFPFGFAALWDSWEGPGGELLETCTILTMDAPEWMRSWHHRCPVMLRAGLAGSWLEGEGGNGEWLSRFLNPWKYEEFEFYQVSNRVNSVAHDDVECTAQAGLLGRNESASVRPVQRDLFS